MNLLVLLLTSSSLVYGNVFELKETSARFRLQITATELSFEGESLRKKIPIQTCNLALAKNLNSEILSVLPEKKIETGIAFAVDGKAVQVDPKSELGKMIFAMEPRITRFILEAKKACN